MDTIWNCAFGLDIDLQNNPNSPYLTKCEQFMKELATYTLLNYIGG